MVLFNFDQIHILAAQIKIYSENRKTMVPKVNALTLLMLIIIVVFPLVKLIHLVLNIYKFL